AGELLVGAVLQRRELQRPAAITRHALARQPVPALAAARVDEPALDEHAVRGLSRRKQRRTVFVRRQRQQIDAEQPLARVAAIGDEGVVDVDQPVPVVLQHSRQRRVPERVRRGRLAHSSWFAAPSACSTAWLISAMPTISLSAASRTSNSDSASIARTRSKYGWYGPVPSASAW